jgi:tetratricopeptide (TPR) repeat protein
MDEALNAGNPEDVREARQRRAALLVREGRLEEAGQTLDLLIADPGLTESQLRACQLRRLCVLLKTGGFDAHRQDWSALLPDPGSTGANSLVGPLAEAAVELETAQQYELARDFYLRLLEMPGLSGHTRVNCHYRLGLVYESLAGWNESLRHYRLAADAPPEFPEAQTQARFRLAELLYLSEDYEAALHQYAPLRSALEGTAEQRIGAQFRFGVCLLRLDRRGEGRRELELCSERAAGTEHGVKSDLSLAELFETQKDFAAARARYRRVIGSHGADPLTKAAALARLNALR